MLDILYLGSLPKLWDWNEKCQHATDCLAYPTFHSQTMLNIVKRAREYLASQQEKRYINIYINVYTSIYQTIYINMYMNVYLYSLWDCHARSCQPCQTLSFKVCGTRLSRANTLQPTIPHSTTPNANRLHIAMLNTLYRAKDCHAKRYHEPCQQE